VLARQIKPVMARRCTQEVVLPFVAPMVLIMPVGPLGLLSITNGTTAVHTSSNWNSTYWGSHQYGYWNGQRGYWRVTGGRHVFVVVN
jgi:hypothetical protein